MTLEKWQSLFSTLQVRYNVASADGSIPSEPKYVKTDLDIETFEIVNRIKLPSDYKSYCKVFGNGIFSDWVSIFAISLAHSEESKYFTRGAIKYVQEDIQRGHVIECTDINFVNKLLDNCFAFAMSSTAGTILWDLSSYSESDGEYDIYYIFLDDLCVSYLGRSFYEFITNFCLGSMWFEVFPDNHKSELLEPLEPYFVMSPAIS